MNSKTLLGGKEGNVSNEMNNIDLVMAFNTQVTQDHNNNNYGYGARVHGTKTYIFIPSLSNHERKLRQVQSKQQLCEITT
jgi:hypothetical protein